MSLFLVIRSYVFRGANAMGETSRRKRGLTVLVADDDDDLRLAIIETLQCEGWSTIAAENGEQAFETAVMFRPDIILLDYRMPCGLGTEVHGRLRKAGVEVPIILMTAAVYAQEVARQIQAAPEDLLMKPFGVEGLLATLGPRLCKASPSSTPVTDDAIDLSS